MSVRITEAGIKPYEIGSDFTRENFVKNRIISLSRAVEFANRDNSVFLVIKGEIADMLSTSDLDLLDIGKAIGRFTGAAILLVADLNDEIIKNVKQLIGNPKLFFFSDDRDKKLSITEMLGIIDSLIIPNTN